MTEDVAFSDALLFRRLTVYNFLSFGPDEVDLDLTQNLLTAVIGVNYDTGGEDSRNGTGKSALFIDAIAYALFGKTIRGITNRNLVHKLARKGQPMGVTLEFTRGPFAYLIERGEPTRFVLFRKPADETRPFRHRERGEDGKMKFIFDRTTSVRGGVQAEITRAVGFDFTLFTYLVGVTSETVPFTKLKESDRREVVESLFGFKRLAEIAEALKEERDTVKKTLTQKDSEIAATDSANARIQTQIDALMAKRTGYYDPYQRQKKIGELRMGEVMAHSKAICEEFYQNDFVRALGKTRDDGLFDHVRDLPTAEARLNELNVHVLTARENYTAVHREVDERHRRVLHEKDVEHETIRSELRQAILDQTKQFAERKAQTSLNQRLFRENEAKRARSTKTIADLRRKIQSLDVDAVCPACGQTVDEEHRLKELDTLSHELGLELPQSAQLEAEALTLTETLRGQSIDAVQAEEANFLAETSQMERQMVTERNLLEAEVIAQIAHDPDLIEAHREVKENERVYQTEQTLSAALTRAKTLEREFAEDTDATNALIEQIREATRMLDPQQNPDPYQEQIESLRTNAMVDLTRVRAEANEARMVVEHYQLLVELATKPDSFIRKNLVARWLPRLNATINTHLRRLELPHRVTFNSEMDMDITNLNSDYSDGNLSKGERTRLIFALIRGFQDLYEHMNHRIGLMSVDELIDSGICNRGAENAVNLLREAAQKDHKRIFLITHRSDIRDQVDSTLTVVKENEISRLRWDRA